MVARLQPVMIIISAKAIFHIDNSKLLESIFAFVCAFERIVISSMVWRFILPEGKMESEKFKKYLRTGSLKGLASIPKSDLHNHISNGGNIEYLAKLAGVAVPVRPSTFQSVTAMEEWAHATIKKHCNVIMRIEAGFVQAGNDGIIVFSASSPIGHITRTFNSCEKYIEFIRDCKDKYIPDALFIPEIQVLGAPDSEAIAKDCDLLDEIYAYNYFEMIDIILMTIDENGVLQPSSNFKPLKKLCEKAKAAGLRIKAHVGEWGAADDVMRAVETLELDEIQHGIAAASSPQIMRWLADNKIQLNLCPSCNIMLERVPSYKEHPIRILYDHGIPVTINTDDMLLTNQSVSQDYLNLYNCGLMSVNELDEVRKTGLSESKKRIA
jgi:adenosine deaminase